MAELGSHIANSLVSLIAHLSLKTTLYAVSLFNSFSIAVPIAALALCRRYESFHNSLFTRAKRHSFVTYAFQSITAFLIPTIPNFDIRYCDRSSSLSNPPLSICFQLWSFVGNARFASPRSFCERASTVPATDTLIVISKSISTQRSQQQHHDDAVEIGFRAGRNGAVRLTHFRSANICPIGASLSS